MPTPTFILGDTEFGVDQAQSLCKTRQQDGQLWLSFDVYGDQAVFDVISADEDSQWSWTLEPPRFYGDFPATRGADGVVESRVTLDDLAEYEVVLYLMNHNDVEVVVRLHPDGTAEAKGTVDLMGEQTPFLARWAARPSRGS